MTTRGLAALCGPSLRPLSGPAHVTYQPPVESRRGPARATALPRPPAPAPVAPVAPVRPPAPPPCEPAAVDSARVGLGGVVAYLRRVDAPLSRRCASLSCPRPPMAGAATCGVCA